MSYLTREEYNAAVKGYEFIDEAVKKLGEDYQREFGGGYMKSIEFFPVSDDKATIEVTEEWNSCGSDVEYYTLPVDYLWDEHWVGREKERRDQKRREAEQHKKEEEAQRAKEREEARYQQFLDMKKEYEGED